MYETEFERLDALGTMTQTIVAGMMRHEATILAITTNAEQENPEEGRKKFAKEAVALACALVEEIKLKANQPQE